MPLFFSSPATLCVTVYRPICTLIQSLTDSNCTEFKQHVMQPTHSRGHSLDLVIPSGLSTSVSSVVDLAVLYHQEAPVRMMRKRYIMSEVAANFIQILKSSSAEILPAPYDFIVNNFNRKLKFLLDCGSSCHKTYKK